MAKFSFPNKLNLAQLPTPIHHLPHLSKKASVRSKVNLYVKRDDINHGVAAGNKIRKLEFLLAEAVAKKKKVVFTCGGVQSNHARTTAALCQQLGLECVLFLRGAQPDSSTVLQGNLLLDKLFGTRIEFITQEQYDDIKKTFFDAGEVYRKRDGITPLFIPEGGSNDIGAMGYVSAFQEIVDQAGQNGLPEKFDSIVVANGSGGTHAGLLLGRSLFGWEDSCEIVSFNVAKTASALSERVKLGVMGAIQHYRLPISFLPSDLHVIDGYVGPGYAQATSQLYDFIVEAGKHDGILLDPVYTGKAMWGLISELQASPERASRFGNNVLFIHTGGLPSLFAHSEALSQAVVRADSR